MKAKTTEQQLKSYSLEVLKAVWKSTQIEGIWKKEVGDNRPMNKKNIIEFLLEDEVFQADAEARKLFTDEKGFYIGLSIGTTATTEDSILSYIQKFTTSKQ